MRERKIALTGKGLQDLQPYKKNFEIIRLISLSKVFKTYCLMKITLKTDKMALNVKTLEDLLPYEKKFENISKCLEDLPPHEKNLKNILNYSHCERLARPFS